MEDITQPDAPARDDPSTGARQGVYNPPMPAPDLEVRLDAVIVAVTEQRPRVLTVPDHDGLALLPSGPLEIEQHPTLDRGLRTLIEAKTAFSPGYLEQLYTFGDRHRDPRRQGRDVPRIVSVAYLALVREARPPLGLDAAFADCYRFLPWEDWRLGRPPILPELLEPGLRRFAGRDAGRRERCALCFGLDGTPWDPERCLDRYELLWEAGLVDEAPGPPSRAGVSVGLAMGQDHRRILATALGRLRGKIRYRPVVFELLPEGFTMRHLLSVVEALSGMPLHAPNFRRLVESQGLVERTGAREASTGGRPAALYRFRREVLRERPAPGVAFSRAWRAL